MLISHQGLHREETEGHCLSRRPNGVGEGDVLVTGRGKPESHQSASHILKKLTHILRLTDIHVMDDRQTDRYDVVYFQTAFKGKLYHNPSVREETHI